VNGSKLRLCVALVVIGAVAAGTAGASSAKTEQAAPVKVRFTVFPGAAPSLGVYIADAMGFFQRNGLEVEYANVGTGTSALQVLLSGNTDFIISDITGAALARKNSGATVVFASGQFRRFMAALQCRPESGVTGSYPAAMRQLEGKRIGITGPGSATDTYLRFTMLAAGANPARASIIPVGGVPNLIAAVQAGSIDCLISYQPIQGELGSRVRTIVNFATGQGPPIFARDYLFNGIATSTAFAGRNPVTVRRVAAAMRQASVFGSNTANAATIAQRVARFFPGIEQSQLLAMVRGTAPTLGHRITRGSIQNALRVYNNIRPDDTVSYPNASFIAPSVRDLTAPRVTTRATVRGRRVTLRWTGRDFVGPADVFDVPSGVARYDLQVRVRNAWRARLTNSARRAQAVTATSARVQYRVRARDRAGNRGPWTTRSVSVR
jgi:NitT/TauT family transport system substrate-binding protein